MFVCLVPCIRFGYHFQSVSTRKVIGELLIQPFKRFTRLSLCLKIEVYMRIYHTTISNEM
uniref:Uncharacterized protein n=1 Tax=Arundo donax TaxID=35708 RepID=A0A0A9C7Q1_ARUDO